MFNESLTTRFNTLERNIKAKSKDTNNCGIAPITHIINVLPKFLKTAISPLSFA